MPTNSPVDHLADRLPDRLPDRLGFQAYPSEAEIRAGLARGRRARSLAFTGFLGRLGATLAVPLAAPLAAVFTLPTRLPLPRAALPGPRGLAAARC